MAILLFYIVPSAKIDKVIGEHGGAIKIKVRAPAVGGKANEALRNFLAERSRRGDCSSTRRPADVHGLEADVTHYSSAISFPKVPTSRNRFGATFRQAIVRAFRTAALFALASKTWVAPRRPHPPFTG